MNSFLERIAKAYYANERDILADCCFIFPNKRSGTFFRQILANLHESDTPVFEPEITTISDFIAEFSDYVEASRYDQLFTLYKAYSGLSAEIEEFDRFVFWGDMLISDFNDVDRYLADPDMLFKNIKDYREISTDFLTDEQKAIISRYWNVELVSGDPDSFWTHINNSKEPRTNRESFVKLWEILAPLYHNYKKSLSDRGLCFSGMQYREVSEKFATMQAPDFPYRRIIIVGFNVLSMSEIKIFERIRDLGIADFYWDFDLPESFKENHSATYFIKRYIKEFPSIHDITLDTVELPDIEIISVPSNIGQVKLTGKILGEMAADGTVTNADNAIDTAIVLPSEELFIDLLHSIPEAYTSVNITMGYPLRLTSIAALMRNVMTLHLRAKKVRDTWCFFHEDIKDVLSHQLLKAIAGKACEELRESITQRRLFTVPVTDIAETYPELSPLFFPVSDMRSAEGVFDYMLRLVDFIASSLHDIEDSDNSLALETGFLTRYRQSLEHLYSTSVQYDIKMKESTFFHLIERTVTAESVNFIGEPLKGLQIMGVLETRALDFDNIILLSMNERIFPRKHYTRSFIPNILRRCYGLSTIEFQECIYAYYFYRMIARARKVRLLYDSRTSGLKGGEMSRYLYQLSYLYPAGKLKRANAFYDVPGLTVDQGWIISKTDRIMERIHSCLSTATEKSYLSPSSINKFLSCPLDFYLSYIERVDAEDEVTDFMDESTFGTIVHQVSELSYKRLRGNAPELRVIPETLDRLIRERVELEKLTTSAINRHYNRLKSTAPDDKPYVNLTPLHGESKVLGEIIVESLCSLFELEKEYTPFFFVEGEMRFKTSLPLDDSRSFNIKGTIDRIDRFADGTVRIVDYKTGSDDIKVGDLSELFEPQGKREPHKKGVLQLFIYSNAYAVVSGHSGPIWPMLYLFKKFATDGLAPITVGGEPLVDYSTVNNDVMASLQSRLARLFDPSVPFTPNPHPAHCAYCNFKAMCGLAE